MGSRNEMELFCVIYNWGWAKLYSGKSFMRMDCLQTLVQWTAFPARTRLVYENHWGPVKEQRTPSSYLFAHAVTPTLTHKIELVQKINKNCVVMGMSTTRLVKGRVYICAEKSTSQLNICVHDTDIRVEEMDIWVVKTRLLVIGAHWIKKMSFND